MPKCSVRNCKNITSRKLKKDGISYFRFPRDPIRCGEWTSIVSRQRQEDFFKPNHSSVVCSEHFLREDMYNSSKGIKRLRKTAVPNVVDMTPQDLKIIEIPDDGGDTEQCRTSSMFNLEIENKFKSHTTSLSTGSVLDTPRKALNHYEDEELPVEIQPGTSSQYENQDSSPKENEIKVFCPKCNTEISHTVEGMQEDQTKIIVARVYHYLEQEFAELKNMYKDMELTPLSRLRKRTALATGVSEATIYQILKEEEERNATKQEELPKVRRRAPKRPKDTQIVKDSSNEDNGDNGEHSGALHETEIETLVVKIEPQEDCDDPEITTEPINVMLDSTEGVSKEQDGSIPINIKTEPREEDAENTNETLAVVEPVTTKRRARKRQRNNDVTTQQPQGESSTAEPSIIVPDIAPMEHLDENNLLGERRIKIEKIEIQEEGFS